MNVKIRKRRSNSNAHFKRKVKCWVTGTWVSSSLVLVFLLSAAACLLVFFYSYNCFFQRIRDNNHSKGDTKNLYRNLIPNPNPSQPLIWIAGLVLDKDDIKSSVTNTLIELNCRHNIGIHVLMKSEHQILPFRKEWRKKQSLFFNDRKSVNDEAGRRSCGPVLIQDQNSLLNATNGKFSSLHSYNTNRIDKISALRDIQRSMLHNIVTGNMQRQVSSFTKSTLEGIIIIADLDLYKIPDAAQIMKQIYFLQDPNYPFDAICTAGITMNIGGLSRTNMRSSAFSIDEPWYYDTFATVFLPDTFSHPLKRRLIPYMYKGENPKLIRSNNQYGNFTQVDIFEYFVNANQGEPVAVKSCFGGMAIYRANAYFDKQCEYRLGNATRHFFQDYTEKQQQKYFEQGLHQGNIFRYANNKEQRPCEHVVFHDCLNRVNGRDFRIALNPSLKTYWKRDF